MLTIFIRNDGTGDKKIGNYVVSVAVNGMVIARERIEGHKRADGWRALVRMLGEQSGEEDESR